MTKALLAVGYTIALVIPFVLVAWLSQREIGTWFSTGICPAGPMDRPARPCGPDDFVFIVFLGGWASFIVIPALLGWWGVCSAVLYAAVRALRTR